MKRTKKSRLSVLLLATVAAAAVSLFAFSDNLAHAATITVTTTTDELNNDGDCSLREAVQAANTDASVDACAAGNGVDIISLAAGTYTLSIAGAGEDANATGDLDITSAVGFVGVGAAFTIIDGGGIDRVLHVVSGTLAATHLTIRNGSAPSGGGIHNDATLILIDSVVSGNTATGAGDHGGGVFNRGFLAVTDSTFSGNSATYGGGGIGNKIGTTTVTNTTFEGNSAGGSGGGILNVGGGAELTVSNVTFSENTASFGGGIGSLDAQLTVTNSTFADNSASFGGGGIGYFHILRFDSVVTNSTFSFSGNSQGGIQGGDPITLRNTIVAGDLSGGACGGTIIDGGGNIQYPGGCGTIPSADPLLDPAGLRPNGGPTDTIALQPDSPAIDGAVAANCPVADQRWFSRLQGAGCDIGAFEREVDAAASAPDADNDGFDDAVETSVGTDSHRACGANAWPADTNDDADSDTSDLAAFSGAFGVPGSARYDVSPAGAPDGFVDSLDLARVAGLFGQTCR